MTGDASALPVDLGLARPWDFVGHCQSMLFGAEF